MSKPLIIILAVSAAVLIAVALIVITAVRKRRKKRGAAGASAAASAETARSLYQDLDASDDSKTDIAFPAPQAAFGQPVELPTYAPDPMPQTEPESTTEAVIGVTPHEPQPDPVTHAQAPRREEAPKPPVPSGQAPIVLVGSGGYFDHKKIVHQGELVIGRHPHRCNVLYPENEKGISALHCKLQRNGTQTWLTDLGSSCGTFVNGEKLRANIPFRLQNGDTFWLADPVNSFFIV